MPLTDDKPALRQNEIIAGFRRIGLAAGQVVLIHSALRTFGRVQGGAPAVVAALLEVIGPGGTLVAPAFTFVHEAETEPVIDPRNDPSEMGIVSETIRRHPQALRSTAYRHSFAAIGRRARVITEVNPTLSPFDLRSSFGVMLALNTQVVLGGVTYSSSTSHHFAEWVCDVPYRRTLSRAVRARGADGTLTSLTMIDYQPKPNPTGSYYGTRSPDFNKLGRMLEERGLVGITAIGNAVVRRFAMRDLIDLAQLEAARDCNIFRTAEGQTDYYTPLDFGKIVFSSERKDGAGRPARYAWCVVDEKLVADLA